MMPMPVLRKNVVPSKLEHGNPHSHDDTRSCRWTSPCDKGATPCQKNDCRSHRKTISAAAGRPLRPDHARETSGTNTRDGDGDGDRRPISRKIAVPTSQSRTDRPKSTFSYVAPLLRTRTLPTKEGPLLPSAHVAEERRERERRRERDEYALGPTRSAPRTSLPSMSVQRRVVQSPRKQQQSPVSRRAPAMTSARGPVPLDRIPDARVHVGRGGKLVFGSSDSEDESSSSSDVVQAQDARIPNPRWTSGGRAPRRQLSTKAARKTKPAAAQPDPIIRLTKAAKKLRVNIDSDEGTDGRRMLVPGERLARKLQAAPVLVSDAEEVIVLSDSEDDVEELYRALDALTLSEARMQKRKRLPFLLKNLWKGFTYQCQRHGVRTSPPNAPRGAVKVVFKYYLEANDSGASSDSSSDAREYQTYVGSMADWRCPMCELHKPFPTREMLIFHLSRDHSEVKVSWREITVRNEHRWRLDLVIPDIAELADSSSEDEEPADVPQEAEDAVPFPNEDQPEVSGAAPTEQLFLPGSDDEESPPPTTPPTLFSSEEVEEKKVLIRSSTSPTPPTAIKRQSSSPHPRGRPSLATAARTSYRGSLPARYPSPPPPHDKLGPAAQYPYLPEKGEDGQELYSCRIGGPRLFDLVSMLPTEEFGIMAWAVVDREEELFEMEDLRDEDKVVLALWNRWIMLNRASFIFKDYFEGVKLFIKRYWQVIHQAAGWRALREFLITLSVNKFLTFDKVLKSLQYYESLTGMALWYKDDIA
ncbi:hypothetical protein OH76DRAFT_999861 [Lentinus brumalis]|uniref:Uncharacterized protein n=1 Tax=Lentinus brumalis TaxID=2498619 RepID=A0A371DQI7_9APHY|nr:hypothetical protein OH76DRAFT_999861 [Polyporus brumalis]